MPKRPGNSDLIEVSVRRLAETDRAILVTQDDKEKIWLPKSQIEFEPNNDGTITVTLPEWLAREKELI